jgi:steroid delta-isomerase
LSRTPSGHRRSTPKARATGAYQCGNEEANVGHILITTGDYQTTAEGVFTYKANDEGKLVALRAYWEMDRAAANTRKV